MRTIYYLDSVVVLYLKMLELETYKHGYPKLDPGNLVPLLLDSRFIQFLNSEVPNISVQTSAR